MGRITKTLTVSLPPKVFDEVDRLAKVERKTKSELFRTMLGVYEDYLDEKRWKKLRKIGAETAKKFDITSEEDIERLVHESRGVKD